MNKEIITMRKTLTEAPIPASIKPTCSVMKFWFTVLMVEYRIISPDNSSTKFIITVCSTLLLSWNVYWPKNLLESRPWQKSYIDHTNFKVPSDRKSTYIHPLYSTHLILKEWQLCSGSPVNTINWAENDNRQKFSTNISICRTWRTSATY